MDDIFKYVERMSKRKPTSYGPGYDSMDYVEEDSQIELAKELHAKFDRDTFIIVTLKNLRKKYKRDLNKSYLENRIDDNQRIYLRCKILKEIISDLTSS